MAAPHPMRLRGSSRCSKHMAIGPCMRQRRPCREHLGIHDHVDVDAARPILELGGDDDDDVVPGTVHARDDGDDDWDCHTPDARRPRQLGRKNTGNLIRRMEGGLSRRTRRPYVPRVTLGSLLRCTEGAQVESAILSFETVAVLEYILESHEAEPLFSCSRNDLRCRERRCRERGFCISAARAQHKAAASGVENQPRKRDLRVPTLMLALNELPLT